jgi:hypothetical protein
VKQKRRSCRESSEDYYIVAVAGIPSLAVTFTPLCRSWQTTPGTRFGLLENIIAWLQIPLLLFVEQIHCGQAQMQVQYTARGTNDVCIVALMRLEPVWSCWLVARRQARRHAALALARKQDGIEKACRKYQGRDLANQAESMQKI